MPRCRIVAKHTNKLQQKRKQEDLVHDRSVYCTRDRNLRIISQRLKCHGEAFKVST